MASNDFAQSAARDNLIKILDTALFTPANPDAMQQAADIVLALCVEHGDDPQIAPPVFRYVRVVAENSAADMETDVETAEFMLLLALGFSNPPIPALEQAVAESLLALFAKVGDKEMALEFMNEFVHDEYMNGFEPNEAEFSRPLNRAALELNDEAGWVADELSGFDDSDEPYSPPPPPGPRLH